MSEPLKLVSDADEKEDLTTRLKTVDNLIDELIAEKEALKEEIEQIRLALGLDRYDFDRLRKDGIRHVIVSSQVASELDKIELKLRKELGYE